MASSETNPTHTRARLPKATRNTRPAEIPPNRASRAQIVLAPILEKAGIVHTPTFKRAESSTLKSGPSFFVLVDA
eukprot:398123-Lingulodinium_polyedra.AAC.1